MEAAERLAILLVCPNAVSRLNTTRESRRCARVGAASPRHRIRTALAARPQVFSSWAVILIAAPMHKIAKCGTLLAHNPLGF
jgi:hypothetical protein